MSIYIIFGKQQICMAFKSFKTFKGISDRYTILCLGLYEIMQTIEILFYKFDLQGIWTQIVKSN